MRSSNEDNSHDGAQYGLDEYQGVRKTKARRDSPRCSVPNNEPRRSWEAIIEYLSNDRNVSVGIGGYNLAGVNFCNPEFRYCRVQRRKGKSGKVKDQRTLVSIEKCLERKDDE